MPIRRRTTSVALSLVVAAAVWCLAPPVAAQSPSESEDATPDEAASGSEAAAEETAAEAEAAAEETASESEAEEEGESENEGGAEADAFGVDLDGAYSFWGLHQRNFFLGRDHPLDDANYVVQNFRLNLKAGRPAYGGVLRADFAQGWWGADNKPNVDRTADGDGEGGVEQSDQYNPYAYFRNKGTHYDIHVDHAYIYFQIPTVPLRMKLGREHRSVGNKLVLDQDLDGVTLEGRMTDDLRAELSWAKISEGFQSFKNPSGPLMSDDGEWSDTDLYGLRIGYDNDRIGGELFGLHYRDNISDWAYYPQGLGYFRARFQPQVSEATALGLKVDGELPVAAGLSYNAEFDYLFGRDDLDNDSYAGNLLDKNNGTLNGYNAYLDVNQAFDPGVPVDLGLVLGMGSGDEDPTGGPGNINKIQTQGFFSLTNVWEDSVMPDVGGISPQGLGSPASRGYRELENTTVGQLSAGVEPFDPLRIDASYSYLRATQPIHGWDQNGPTDETSSAIGQEIDLNLHLELYENLKAVTLGGVFLPGEGSSLLINGEKGHTDPAWEIKQVLLYKFSMTTREQ